MNGVASLALKAYRFADNASFSVDRVEVRTRFGQFGPGEGQFWPGQALAKAVLSSIWVAGCGRSADRVVELLESKALGVFAKIDVF